MKNRKLNKQYHFCRVCEREKSRQIARTQEIPKFTNADIRAIHRITSIKRRRHRRDMRKDPLYRFIWKELDTGLERALNKAFLGVEDPKDFTGLRPFEGDLFDWLGLEDGVDYTVVEEPHE
jgi:hypothetical protein